MGVAGPEPLVLTAASSLRPLVSGLVARLRPRIGLGSRRFVLRLRLSPSSSSSASSSSSSSSSTRWKQRQGRDVYAREARVQGLKSRAAFKLLEIDAKHGIFRPGQLVVDLGYAPGSWSQVAMERTRPFGRVVGIDLIPAQPPPGVATFQGDFLSPQVQRLVKDFVIRIRAQQERLKLQHQGDSQPSPSPSETTAAPIEQPSYIDQASDQPGEAIASTSPLVDVVLSDMSAPWDQTSGFSANTLSNPYRRLMNTSGIAFRDHAGSMDLCTAALRFAVDTLRPGGHLICKFYQGSEDKALERRLKKLFAKVHREKPESSRNESKEAYFVALRKRKDATLKEDVENHHP